MGKCIFQLGLFFYLVFISSTVLSAPSGGQLSGTISDGQQITITGANFGASGPNILLFDDFSGAANGEQLPTSAIIGTWDRMPSIAFVDPQLSKGQGARCVGPSGWLNANLLIFGATYSEVFVSSMGYVPSGYLFPYGTELLKLPDISALKHHWLYYGPLGYAYNNDPDIFGPNWAGSSFYAITSNDAGDRGAWDTGTPVNWQFGEPIRWTHWVKGNGTSIIGSDGMFQSVSSVGHNITRYKDYKQWFYPSDNATGFDRLTVVGYLRNGVSAYPKANYVVDDVYVAVGPNSQARVELGNAPVYENCSKFAISTPDSWSNTEIKFTLREGGFKTEDIIYVFVVDSNGNYSDGCGPVSIGQAGTFSCTFPAPAISNITIH